MNTLFVKILAAALISFFCCVGFCANDKAFKFSTTIEKERPELGNATKQLIAAYRRNPTNDNYNTLRKQVEINYDKVLARKKAKLAELQKTAGKSKIDEMQVIVDEMIKDRDSIRAKIPTDFCPYWARRKMSMWPIQKLQTKNTRYL